MSANSRELPLPGIKAIQGSGDHGCRGSEHYAELLKNNLGTNIGTDIGGSTYDEAGIVKDRLLRITTAET